MNINDMMKVALTNLNEVLEDENSLNCMNRMKLKKAESLIKLVSSGIVASLSDIYWDNDQFHAISDAFMTYGNNEDYRFFFLADEGKKMISAGKADPEFLLQVLEEVKSVCREAVNHDKSNN